MKRIEKSIIQTISFFDLLSRPLTLEEIWHYLYQFRASKLQVFMGLKDLLNEKIIGKAVSPKTGNIFYHLSERPQLASEYFTNFSISANRWQKVDRVLKIIRLTPFVKMIAVINSLSYNNSSGDSDIDILIIAKRGRLWTARAFIILMLEIIGQNKNQWYKADKFCLGFALDESRLDIGKIKFKNDIDFTYWLANLTPVYDRGIYRDLIEANPWIHQELPNWQEKNYSSENAGGPKLRMIEKLLLGRFGDRLENRLAKIQINRIWRDPKNKRQGASVIADPGMMKLHPYDKRQERQQTWKLRLDKILKNTLK